MRAVLLVAVSLLMIGLIAGCSRATVQRPQQTTSSGSARPSAAPTTASSHPPPNARPGTGAPISEVISWIEAGRPVDAAGYHSATRDGVTTELGEGVAFTVADSSSPPAATCVTDPRHTAGALACLVAFSDPPPRPAEVYGEWKGNWVDFDGTTLQVGSAHGDPGPFANGDGPQLPSGATLSFSDYRCRADQLDLFCVNYAHRSAVRLSSTGATPFGCLQPVPAPPGAGKLFSC